MAENLMNEGTAAEAAAPTQEKETGLRSADLEISVTPFRFEGKEYKSVDLRKLKTMTARQLQQVETTMIEEGLGTQAVWTSLRGSAVIAEVLNNMPRGWLDNMSAKDGITVRNVVFAFFIGLV